MSAFQQHVNLLLMSHKLQLYWYF